MEDIDQQPITGFIQLSIGETHQPHFLTDSFNRWDSSQTMECPYTPIYMAIYIYMYMNHAAPFVFENWNRLLEHMPGIPSEINTKDFLWKQVVTVYNEIIGRVCSMLKFS